MTQDFNKDKIKSNSFLLSISKPYSGKAVITAYNDLYNYLARPSLFEFEIINSTLGMIIHRWTGGTLFRTCIKLRSKQREIVVHLSLCAFRKCVQKWGYVCFFKNKWNGLPTFQFGIEAALFSTNLWKGIFFWTDCWQDFPRFPCYYQKLFWVLFCALIAF